MSADPAPAAGLPARLTELALLAMLFVLAVIQTVALVIQYSGGEIPCPLCLLQRVAMFGVCFGLVMHVRDGYSARNIGMSMLFAVFLLIVSVRQTLLNIYPRPGHAYPGSAVLGLHMPVWAVLIAVALLTAFALQLAVLGGERLRDGEASPLMQRLGGWLSLAVIALCLVNLVSVILQCGLGECHTSGYALL